MSDERRSERNNVTGSLRQPSADFAVLANVGLAI